MMQSTSLHPHMRVLVVDDNRDTAFLVSELVRLCGHEAKMATGSDEALQIAATFQPELVFLDIALPHCNGYQLAPRLRNEAGLNGAIFVAYSGYKDDPAARIAAGIDAHLLKPVSLEQLTDFFDCEPLKKAS
jgi:two-component system, chemotaxis family, CheB/CheR fusion protein